MPVFNEDQGLDNFYGFCFIGRGFKFCKIERS